MPEPNIKTDSTIRVYIANLGRYNEGALVGGWLDLPQPQAKIDEFLQNTVGLTLDPQEAYEKGLNGERVYEEYAIHDFEFPQDLNGFTPNIGEYTPLRAVNVLACLLEQVDDDDLAIIEAYQQEIKNLDAIEQASMLTHFAEGEYPDLVWTFDTEGFKNDNEAYGHYCVYELNPELSKVLKEQNIESYFDFENYGEAQAHDGYLHDGIYIDGRSDIGEWADYCDIGDMQEYLAEVYGEEYFESLGDQKLWAEREALGKEHGFALEGDEDDYYYCRSFQSAEGKDINTIVEYDPEKQQWTAYTVDFNQPSGHRKSQETYRSDLAEAFAVGNALYAEISNGAALKSWDSIDENHFYQAFEVDGQELEQHVEYNPADQCWETYTYDCQTEKTGDVWTSESLEAAIKTGQASIDDQIKVANDTRNNVVAGKPARASTVEELATRGTQKAEEHNKHLRNDRTPNVGKRSR